MNTVSSYLSSQDWAQRLRQPMVLATVLSLGLHGVIFAALPLLARGSDKPEEPESVSVVELSPEEVARLPAFAQDDGFNPNNFANPLVTQDGVTSLPVPGSAPLGDLTTDFDFSDPLSSPGSFGPPLDLLPPVPVEGGNPSFGDSSFFAGALPPSKPLPQFTPQPPAPAPQPIPAPKKFSDAQLEEPKVNLDPMSPLTKLEKETPLPSPPQPNPGEADKLAQKPSLPPTPEPTPGEPLPTPEEAIAAERAKQVALLEKYAADGTGPDRDSEDMISRQEQLTASFPGTTLGTKTTKTLDLPADFPKCERDLHTGVFGALVAPEGGAPTQVDVLHSTGVGVLNQEAIAAIQAQPFEKNAEGLPALHYVEVSFNGSGETCTSP